MHDAVWEVGGRDRHVRERQLVRYRWKRRGQYRAPPFTLSSEVVDRYRLRYEIFGEITGIRNGCSEGLFGHGQRVLNPASAIL